MANISAELQAILDAVYGEEVRNSIHDAIEKINDVSTVTLSVGVEVTSSTSSTIGYYEDSLYLNNQTWDLWRCRGNGIWDLQGNVKGEKGIKGDAGTSVIDAIDNGNGTFHFTLSDGSNTSDVATIKGDKGEKGDTGETGTAGRSVTSIEAGTKVGIVTPIYAYYSDGTSNLIGNISDGTSGSGAGDMTYAMYDPTESGIVNYANALSDRNNNFISFTGVVNKADKATTLAGYGITDAYTKAETSSAISSGIDALDVASVGGAGQYISSISETDGKINAVASQLSNAVDGTNVVVNNNKINLGSTVTDKLSTINDDGTIDAENINLGGVSLYDTLKNVVMSDYYSPTKYYYKGDLCIYENEIYEQYGYAGALIGWSPAQASYWRKRSLSEIAGNKVVSSGRITEFPVQTKYKVDTSLSGLIYFVKNNVCYVSISVECVQPWTGAIASGDVGYDLPAPHQAFWVNCPTYGNTFSAIIMNIAADGSIQIKNGTAGTRYAATFSYPIKQ